MGLLFGPAQGIRIMKRIRSPYRRTFEILLKSIVRFTVRPKDAARP